MEVAQSRRSGGSVAGRHRVRSRPLVVTGDDDLLDELLRLAEAGGVEVTVAVDAVAAERDWASAPLVVVGVDRADEVARRRLPRRLDVVVVAGARRGDDPALWPGAAALHAEHLVVLPDARPWLAGRFAEHGAGRGILRRAGTLAVVGGSEAVAAGELALALAEAARGRGLVTTLISASEQMPGIPVDQRSRTGAGLTVVCLAGGGAGVAPEAMAVALRSARDSQDLVVVALPVGLDEAALLALTCADRTYLVVAAEVKACAGAARAVATVRRHCPDVELVVRSAGLRGLRPVEVAQALGVRLAGVIPPEPPLARAVRVGRPESGAEGGPLGRLSRTLLTRVSLRSPGGTGGASR